MLTDAEPDIEFLLDASDSSRSNMELASLNRAANLRKDMKAMQYEVLRLEAQALLASWLRRYSRQILDLRRTNALQEVLDFGSSYGVNALAVGNPPKGLR